MYSGYFWSSQEKTQTLFEASEEFKSVNAILSKLRDKQKSLMEEGEAIKSSDIYKAKIEIAKYKQSKGEPVHAEEEPLACIKAKIIESLLKNIDGQIDKFNRKEMDVFGLATTLNAKLSNIEQLEWNLLNLSRNNNAYYAYKGSSVAVRITAASATMAAAPVTGVASLAAGAVGANVVGWVDDKVRHKLGVDDLSPASAKLVRQLVKAVAVVLEEIEEQKKGKALTN